MSSIRTVLSHLQNDARRVAQGKLPWKKFVASYGHLRPGTYDITSPTYASLPNDFLKPLVAASSDTQRTPALHVWDPRTRKKISRVLKGPFPGLDPMTFSDQMRSAIEGREHAKFLFTRNISAALEELARYAATLGLSREEAAHVSIDDFLSLRSARGDDPTVFLKQAAQAGREAYALTQSLCLPSLIFSKQDVVCHEQRHTEPNFIAHRRVRAPILSLSQKSGPSSAAQGKIILLPNADPGFDWLFSAKIAGLITLYGGVNSHMAVRAAELNLPAAIGVGEILYNGLSKAAVVDLNCANRTIKVIR